MIQNNYFRQQPILTLGIARARTIQSKNGIVPLLVIDNSPQYFKLRSFFLEKAQNKVNFMKSIGEDRSAKRHGLRYLDHVL